MEDKKDNLSEIYDSILKETENNSLKIEKETQQIFKQSSKLAKNIYVFNIIVLALLTLVFIIRLINFANASNEPINPVFTMILGAILVSGILSINYLRLYSINMSKSLNNYDSKSLKEAANALSSYLRIKFIFLLIGFVVFILAFVLILFER